MATESFQISHRYILESFGAKALICQQSNGKLTDRPRNETPERAIRFMNSENKFAYSN